MNEREHILRRVREALAPLGQRAPLPEYGIEIAAARMKDAGPDLIAQFSERIRSVNGRAFTDPAELAAHLRERKALHGYCDPALWPRLAPAFGAGFTVETGFDRARVDDYAFGITRAAGAVAETGTLILTDASTSRRLAALAPWAHVAVVGRAQIFPRLSQAVAALGTDPNVVWCTGSSSTADVEGIIIQGVHGPGAQIALFLD